MPSLSSSSTGVATRRLLYSSAVILSFLITYLGLEKFSGYPVSPPAIKASLSSSHFNGSISAAACSMATFQYPVLQGVEFLSIEANVVTNASGHAPYYMNNPPLTATDVNYCNITLEYTHPGQNDTLHTQVWMPIDNWNGRMQGIGGGGWVAGLFSYTFESMLAAVSEGFVAVSSDAGLTGSLDPTWALLSPGNVNLYLLQNIASVSLNEGAIIGKAITENFYGQRPRYSYWNGCSQGGRQGLMLAQRYPDAYDGIAAGAPAINWSVMQFSNFWPALVMNELGEYPRNCEMDAITAATVSACDGNDGIVDGVISDPSKCKFDPESLVGRTIKCSDTGANRQISSVAEKAVKAAWNGPEGPGKSSTGFGVTPGTNLTGWLGIASTSCTEDNICTSVPFSVSESWIRLFVMKNATADLTKLSRKDFKHLFHTSVQQYDSIIGTVDPDLREFRDIGGKMITYHGLMDPIISPLGMMNYYDAVTKVDPGVKDYYRLFTAPGLEHCASGTGVHPDSTFEALMQWVENGVVPETLNATSLKASQGPVLNRPLCTYPKKQYYKGKGDWKVAENFYCK